MTPTAQSQLRPLLAASVKMFYRSLDTVWFAAVSPFILLAVLALVRRLHFGLAHGGSISFFTFTAIGFAAFIAAQVLTRLAVAVVQTVAFLAAAIALGATIHYSPELIWIVPLTAIAVLTGTGFGFAIAGAAKSPEAANQINIAIFTPVFLLAGVQYPLQGLPGALPEVAEYLVPFAAPVQAFREAVAGHLGGDFPRLILISLGWLALALTLAVRNYRLVERDA